jgi:DNA repair protein RecO (recombination protein O)
MPLFKTNAIVIRSFNYGESDKIVTFFTKDFGKIKGIAKGARRSKNLEAFDLLLSFLSALEEMEPKEEQLRMFEIRMLSLFGYQPNMRRCDLCKKGWEDLREVPIVFFSLEKGALVCENCSKGWNNLICLSLGTARLIERISQMELPKIHRLRFTSLALTESRELLPRFISYQLGKELKSLKTLRGMGPNFSSYIPLSPGGRGTG